MPAKGANQCQIHLNAGFYNFFLIRVLFGMFARLKGC
jgi:hypothetical protein